MRASIRESLNEYPFLDELPEHWLDRLADLGQRVSYQTSQRIFAGSVLGWSWMFPPYRWHFGAVAAPKTRSAASSPCSKRGASAPMWSLSWRQFPGR